MLFSLGIKVAEKGSIDLAEIIQDNPVKYAVNLIVNQVACGFQPDPIGLVVILEVFLVLILVIGEDMLIAHLCAALVIQENLKLQGVHSERLLQAHLLGHDSLEHWLGILGLTDQLRGDVG